MKTGPTTSVTETAHSRPGPRLRQPNRDLAPPPLSWDQLLPPEHPARLVWDFALGLDLTALYQSLKVVHGGPGRAAADPRLLVALWLYATYDGVGSARELARRCDPRQGSLPYLWLSAGVSLNYHSLSDFRVAHADLLDRLLSDALAVMLSEGLLDLGETAQDSIRVRASAGSASFRRRGGLQECQRQARRRVAQLRQQVRDDPSGPSRRQRAARQRAASERQKRLEQALVELAKIEQQRQRRGRGEEKDRGAVEDARASTTDPEARKMKMADGGFRPAYSVEFNTTTAGKVIVGLDVSNHGSDSGRVVAMLDQTERRCSAAPQRHLVDSGFGTHQDIVEAAKTHATTTLYAPVKNAKKKEQAGEDPYRARKNDGPAVAAWRVRMGTEQAKGIYKRRAATAEWANAQARNRGLYAVRVRGLAKVRAVVLWYALVHNMTRLWALRAAKQAA
jgi:transposase